MSPFLTVHVVLVPGDQFAASLRSAATCVRMDAIANPLGSTLSSDHSRWPMRLLAVHPYALQITAAVQRLA